VEKDRERRKNKKKLFFLYKCSKKGGFGTPPNGKPRIAITNAAKKIYLDDGSLTKRVFRSFSTKQSYQ
jgi:hypothetical protein